MEDRSWQLVDFRRKHRNPFRPRKWIRLRERAQSRYRWHRLPARRRPASLYFRRKNAARCLIHQNRPIHHSLPLKRRVPFLSSACRWTRIRTPLITSLAGSLATIRTTAALLKTSGRDSPRPTSPVREEFQLTATSSFRLPSQPPMTKYKSLTFYH